MMVSSYLFAIKGVFVSLHFFSGNTHRFGKLYHVTQPIPECDVSRDLKTLPEEGDKTLTCSANISEMYFLFSQIVMTTH